MRGGGWLDWLMRSKEQRIAKVFAPTVVEMFLATRTGAFMKTHHSVGPEKQSASRLLKCYTITAQFLTCRPISSKT